MPCPGRSDWEGYARAHPGELSGGAYPLARFLYVYVNKKPNEPMDKLMHEFVKFCGLEEGQEIVVKDGYYPSRQP